MTTIATYQTDETGLFLYEDKAQQFALDPDRHNVAFRAVLKAPPVVPEGMRARWISESAATDPAFLDGSWIIEEIPPVIPTTDVADPPKDAVSGETINPQ